MSKVAEWADARSAERCLGQRLAFWQRLSSSSQLAGLLIVATCWLGTVLLRPVARRWLHEEPRLNDMLSAFLQYFGVIYGLLLGLLAVATWQDRSEVEKGIANEASSLAALYRDVSSYPEPDRTELQNLIRGHTRYIIDQVWPLQREGTPPVYERKRVEVIQARRFSIAERDSMLTPTRCPGAVKLDRRYLLPRGLTVVSKNRRVA